MRSTEGLSLEWGEWPLINSSGVSLETASSIRDRYTLEMGPRLHYPDWQHLCVKALMELDLSTLPERVRSKRDRLDSQLLRDSREREQLSRVQTPQLVRRLNVIKE